MRKTGVIRRTERNIRTAESRRSARGREIRGFGDRHRELCPQDFLSPEALRCYERSNKKMQ